MRALKGPQVRERQRRSNGLVQRMTDEKSPARRDLLQVQHEIFTMIQGQGSSTSRKESGFAALLRLSLRISKAPTAAKNRYWHIDMNAGSGFNGLANCDGSPVIFLKQAAAVRRSFTALFCDIDAENTQLLNSRIAGMIPDNSSVTVVCGDNEQALNDFSQLVSSSDKQDYGAMARLFASTFALTITNPATMLGFLAIFSGVAGLSVRGESYGHATTLVASVFSGSVLWWLCLSQFVNLFRHRLNDRLLEIVNRVSGVLIAGFGIAVLARVLLNFFG